MADDLERLVVQLEASLTKFDKELRKASGISEREFRKIERRGAEMSKKLDAATSGLGRSLVPSLGAIGAALSVKEVASYADAWTKAKNSLAVAGVVGQQQATVLDALFASAQKNAAPIGALADLYGKAAQSQKELGATSGELQEFTDGVAVSLRVAGKSSTEASGALTQLGQLLGSTHMMAEEFNSINEGARPILMAVAAGLDEAGGSVSKLKQLVHDGAVSNRAFIQAFLKGMPAIQAMAANATQTIAQGLTKIDNELIKYIGSQDQALSATCILSNALNYLADNFDQTADVVLKVAGVIAAALVGRAIGGMITSLGIAGPALLRFISSLRTAAGMGPALAGLATSAGPIGAAMGAAAAVAGYFYLEAGKSAEAAARAGDAIAAMGEKSRGSAADVKALVEEMAKLSRAKLLADVGDTSALITQQSQRLQSSNPFYGARFTTPSADLNDALNSYFRGAAEDAFKEFDRATDKFLKGGSLVDYKRSLDDLAKRFPDQASKLAEAQKAADLYTAAIERRGMQDKALAAQESGTTGPAPNRRTVEDSSMSALEKQRADAQNFLDRRKLENPDEREHKITERAEKIAAALEKAGQLIDRAQVRLQATKEIDAEYSAKQSQSFSGDAIKDFVDRVVKAESGGNTNAKNPYSTATGLGQFIESTWINLFKKVYPAQAATMSRSAILDLRKNGEISRKLIEEYAKENAEALQKSGNAVTEANLHLAHFLGPTGAAKALANPRGNARDVLGSGVVDANKAVFSKTGTAQDAIDYSIRRANATRYAAGDLTPEEKSAKDFTDTLKDSDARTAALARETEALNQLTYAREYAAEKARLIEEVEREGRKATPEQIKDIEAKAAAYAKAQQTLENSKGSIEGLKDARSS